MNRPIFIVGLQKSGTSLLVRLLEVSGLGTSTSGKVEDNSLWGHAPSFAPTEWPAGMIYQATNGANGHEIGKEYATEDIIDHLQERLVHSHPEHREDGVIFSKSPYNTVRIPWVRAIFPDSIIVAVVRRPVPNVFSLWKRYHPKAPGRGPEEGWWGVKPKEWRCLVHTDKIVQAAHQWKNINCKLWQDRDLVDIFVPYHDLCSGPEKILRRLYSESTGKTIHSSLQIPPLSCYDDEYKRGARLDSKNKYYRDTGSLEVPEEDLIEVSPFTQQETETIINICRETAEALGLH